MASKNKDSQDNDKCQKEGCNRVVGNRRFCETHTREEQWRFENERMKFRQQMAKQSK